MKPTRRTRTLISPLVVSASPRPLHAEMISSGAPTARERVAAVLQRPEVCALLAGSIKTLPAGGRGGVVVVAVATAFIHSFWPLILMAGVVRIAVAAGKGAPK